MKDLRVKSKSIKLCFLLNSLLCFLFFSSCSTSSEPGISSSAVGKVSLDLVKQFLLNGVNNSFSILENPDSYQSNNLIDSAMPKNLQDINSKLQTLGLGSLVNKEKLYIGQAVATAANVAKPIVNSAIQEITLQDAIMIATTKGGATKYLKDKTKEKLISAIQPTIKEKLETSGISSLFSNALQSTLFGGTDLSSQISDYASEQAINGFFNLMQNYESNNSILTNQTR